MGSSGVAFFGVCQVLELALFAGDSTVATGDETDPLPEPLLALLEGRSMVRERVQSDRCCEAEPGEVSARGDEEVAGAPEETVGRSVERKVVRAGEATGCRITGLRSSTFWTATFVIAGGLFNCVR